MSYSRQSCNGTVVENKNGEIFVNGVNIKTVKQSIERILFIAASYIFVFMAGIAVGAL